MSWALGVAGMQHEGHKAARQGPKTTTCAKDCTAYLCSNEFGLDERVPSHNAIAGLQQDPADSDPISDEA